MSTKARITYRFDKQSGARVELPLQEKPRASDADAVSYFQEELKFTTDIGAWNSPFQNDAQALEQLIREADGQIPNRQSQARTGERAETLDQRSAAIAPNEAILPPYEDNDTILLGDEEDDRAEAPLQAYSKRAAAPPVIDMYPQIEIDEDLYDNRNRRVNKGGLSAFPAGSARRPSQGPSWFKVFASVAGAIATGALFGYFVLTLFTGGTGTDSADTSAGSVPAVSGNVAGDGKSAAGTAANGTSAGAGNAKADGKDAVGTTNAGTVPAVKVDVPAAAYYMLQYGVFSNKDGLDAAAAELRGKGLAAASLTSKEDFRIYVGMSTDRNEAELLGQTLTGMDVYVKQIDLPALSAIAYKGAAADVQSFFEDTAGLLAKLDGMTVAQLSGQPASGGNDWQALHQKWTESASRIESGMTDKTNKDSLSKLVQAVNSAAVAAGEYGKKPSEAYLWSMQTSLMNAVFIQKAWFESMESL